MQISDVVDRVGFRDAKSALVILKQIMERRPTNVTPLIHGIRTLQKEIRSWHAQ